MRPYLKIENAVMQALRRWKQEDQELRLSWATELEANLSFIKPVSKALDEQINQTGNKICPETKPLPSMKGGQQNSLHISRRQVLVTVNRQ